MNRTLLAGLLLLALTALLPGSDAAQMQLGRPGGGAATAPAATAGMPTAAVPAMPAAGGVPSAAGRAPGQPATAAPAATTPAVAVPGVAATTVNPAAAAPTVPVGMPAVGGVVTPQGVPGAPGVPGLPGTPAAAATAAAAPAAALATAAGAPGAVGSGVAVVNSVTALAINPTGTRISAAYAWNVVKRFASGATTEAVTVAVGGTATASYQIVVTKALTSQQVAVAGTFAVTGSGDFTPPTVALVPAPAAVPSTSINCNPPGSAPATCSFVVSWSDSSVSAAAGGTVTVSVGGSTASAPYNFAGGATGTTAGVAGQCATITDSFTASALSASNIQPAGSYPPPGMQVCDNGDKMFQYTVTFQNMQQAWCAAPITATNVVTVTPTGAPPVTASATATITVTGCTGAATASIASALQTVVVNTYSWTLTKTGGGAGLTTTPQQELSIPFTITATQTLTSSAGWVGGTATFQNMGGSPVTLTSFTISFGSGTPQTVPVGNCGTSATVPAQGTASCTFNVTAPAAPAAGTVSAAFTYTAGSSAPVTATSTAVPYSFTSAVAYNLGGTANLYDTVDTSSLATLTAAGMTADTSVRLSPADAAPPTTAPGVTLSGSKTFTYNVVVGRLTTCGTDKTITNTATLVPVGGSQGTLSKAASATFSATGCSVLPTVTLSNIQTWAAVTWSWTLQKQAVPNVYQVPVGAGATANYQVQMTRSFTTGNYFLSGSIALTNPATYTMYISSVTLMSTTGQVGALPPACLGGSNVGGGTISTGINNLNPFQGAVNPYTGTFGTTPGGFAIAAGANIQCVFNVSAGTGSAPQGNLYAQATTTASYVGAGGNTAISQSIPIDFTGPTQQWNLGGCITFTDQAVTQGAAGAWTPTMTGLPQQQRICGSRTYQYGGVVSPVPLQGATCNQPVNIVNTASGVPDSGSQAVTATATIQVMATGCAGASPAPLAPQAAAVALPPSPVPTVDARAQSGSMLDVSVQPDSVRVAATGDYEWGVAINSSASAAGGVSVPVGSRRAVLYSVVAVRRPGFTWFVSGAIAVANPNDAPIAATSVVALLPMGSVPAVCQGGKLPLQVPPGGSITCAFNATLTAAAPGNITAAATSSLGTSSSARGVPYTMDVAPRDAKGACAVVVDTLASRPALTRSTVAVAGNRPAGAQLPQVCTDSTAYNFTATFGPFPETGCASYMVSAAASVTPADGPQAPMTARDALPLRVTGCAAAATATMQSVESVVVAAAPPQGSSAAAYHWSARTEGTFANTLRYQDSTALAFNVSWVRVDATTSRLMGVFSVTNPSSSATAVTLKAASVLPEFADAAAPTAAADGAPAALDAQCQHTTLAPGASTNCSYSGSVQGGGSGQLLAQVVLANNAIVSSAPVSFSLLAASSRRSPPGAAGCADITTGLFLSPLLVAAGSGAGGSTPQQFRACESGSRVVNVKLGPFAEGACGEYAVTSTTRVRPAAASGQQPFSSVGVARVVVSGCPLSETPQPEVFIAQPDLNVTSSVRYAWQITHSSSGGDPLLVRYDRPAEVVVAVDVRRTPGQRSVTVEGVVQLAARGTKPFIVQRVQVATQQRLGQLQTVDALCPDSAKAPEGGYAVPARPQKLLCSFRLSGLPPMDGSVAPLVFAAVPSGAAAGAAAAAAAVPLPAEATIYRVANAPRVALGECAVLGASRTLRKQGAAYAVEGQPSTPPAHGSSSSGLPSTPVCSSLSTTFPMRFGPFGADGCGSYTFSGDVSARPSNSSSVVRDAMSFAVQVGGCS